MKWGTKISQGKNTGLSEGDLSRGGHKLSNRFFQAFLPVGSFFPGILVFEDQAAIGEDMGVELLGQKRIPLSFDGSLH